MPYTPDVVAKETDLGLSQANPLSASSRVNWLPFATIAILLIILYHRVAIKLVYDWYTIPDYSHGFLVPFFAAFLIWDRRKVLKATPIKQTWSGLVLVDGPRTSLPPSSSRPRHPLSGYPVQPDNLPPAASGLKNRQRRTALTWRPDIA